MEIKINSNYIWKYGLKYFTWPWEILKAMGKSLSQNPNVLVPVGCVLFLAMGVFGLVLTGISIYEEWGVFVTILIPMVAGAAMWALGDTIDWLVDTL